MQIKIHLAWIIIVKTVLCLNIPFYKDPCDKPCNREEFILTKFTLNTKVLILVDLHSSVDITPKHECIVNRIISGEVSALSIANRDTFRSDDKTAFEVLDAYIKQYGTSVFYGFIFFVPEVDANVLEGDLLFQLAKLQNRRPLLLLFYYKELSVKTNEEAKDKAKSLIYFFQKLWIKYKFSQVVGLLTDYDCSETVFFTYDHKNWLRNSSTYGYGIRFLERKIVLKNPSIAENPNMFEGFTLNVPLFNIEFNFHRTPITLPPSFEKLSAIIDGYKGMDALLFADILQRFKFKTNFTKILSYPAYGSFKNPCETSGSMKMIVEGMLDIAPHTRLLKYHTDRFQYLYPVTSEQICVVVLDKGMKPTSEAAYSLLSWKLIAIVGAVVIFVSFVTSMIDRSFSRTLKYRKYKNECLTFLWAVIETFLSLLVATPMYNYITQHFKRMFFFNCLVLSIFCIALFQASVSTALAKSFYYNNIDTLEELDEAVTRIQTSETLEDVFINDDENSSALELSLKSKVYIEGDHVKAADLESLTPEKAVVGSEQRLKFLIDNPKFHTPGGFKYHIVKECPKSFYKSIIASRNFPFTEPISRFLSRILESGIVQHYITLNQHAFTLRFFTSLAKYNTTYEREQYNSLNVQDFDIPLAVLGVGSIASFLVFILELIVDWFSFIRSDVFPFID